MLSIYRLKKEEKEPEKEKRVPLSLEELLAKKKAEEEAQSKVCKEYTFNQYVVGCPGCHSHV